MFSTILGDISLYGAMIEDVIISIIITPFITRGHTQLPKSLIADFVNAFVTDRLTSPDPTQCSTKLFSLC